MVSEETKVSNIYMAVLIPGESCLGWQGRQLRAPTCLLPSEGPLVGGNWGALGGVGRAAVGQSIPWLGGGGGVGMGVWLLCRMGVLWGCTVQREPGGIPRVDL